MKNVWLSQIIYFQWGFLLGICKRMCSAKQTGSRSDNFGRSHVTKGQRSERDVLKGLTYTDVKSMYGTTDYIIIFFSNIEMACCEWKTISFPWYNAQRH